MLASVLHDLVMEIKPYMKKGVEFIIDDIKTILSCRILKESLSNFIIQTITWSCLVSNLIVELNRNHISNQLPIIVNATTVNSNTC